MKKEEGDETGETPKTTSIYKNGVEKQETGEGEKQKPSTSKDMDSEATPESSKTSNDSVKSDTKKEEAGLVKKDESDVEMEEKEKVVETYLDVALLHSEPIYAELCSFFNVFGALLNMKPVSFARLDKIFCTLHNGEADGELIDLHIQMMRKIYLKSARADKWENSLLKFCSVCPALESELLQLQRYSYNDLPLSLKLTMLKALCESQFDCNVKFKENLFNTFQTSEIRIAPIGVDRNGLSYFYQQDCELNVRVYTVEPDDQSGGTWALKAKSERELAFLVDLLKSPDFGKKRDDDAKEDEEMDEDQLVDKNPTKNGEQESNTDKKPLPSAIQMTEEERQAIQMFNKRYTFWDCYHDESNLNKKKTAKELRKKEKETLVIAAATTELEEKTKLNEIAKHKKRGDEGEAVKSSEDESKKKKEDAVDPDLDGSLIALANEERRILPRRSARSNAINNLKAFTAPQKKGNIPPNNTHSTPKIKKEPFKSEYIDTGPASNTSDEDELFDEEDEEDEESGSSDDEFHPDGSRPTPSTKSNTCRSAKKKSQKKRGRNGSQRQPGKPPTSSKSVKNRAQKRSAGPSMPAKINHKSIVMSFVDSSDEEEEVEEALKERKKATEKTLCMQCNSSKRPDVLLLCDMCDDAWHTYCLKPSLWFVPDGDWFCPKCQHSMLVKKLSLALVNLTEALKVKQSEEKKKQTVADRLKREMDFIGVSLNNIIPSKSSRSRNGYRSSSQYDEDEEDEKNDGQRKCKKKAMRKVLSKTGRQERQREMHNKYYGPIMTIAEGRSRRTLSKVDYNFHAYDEQLQEAMETIDSSIKVKDEPISGLGRGKDMANIIEEDRKRKISVDTNSENNAPAVAPLPVSSIQSPEKRSSSSRNEERGFQGQPPRKKEKKKKQHKRLTDLDIDNATESDDTDEYKATSESEKSDEPEPSEDEYLPREFRRSGRTTRGGKTRSDDEFIDDNVSSSSDYGKPSKRNKSGSHRRRGSSGRNGSKAKRGAKKSGKKGRRKPWESDEETSEAEQASDYNSENQDSSDSGKKDKRKGGRALVARPPASKWAPKASSSSEGDEQDEEELEMPSGSSSADEKTETGRPLRKAAVDMRKKMQNIDREEEEEEDEDQPGSKKKNQRPVGALTRPRRVVLSDDEAEFEPDEEDEEGDASSAEEEEEDKNGKDEQEEDEAPTLVKATTILDNPSLKEENTTEKEVVRQEDGQTKKAVPSVQPPKEVEQIPNEEESATEDVKKEVPQVNAAEKTPDKHEPKPQPVVKVVQRVQRKPSAKMSRQSSQEDASSPSGSQPPKLNSPFTLSNKAVNSPASTQGPSTPSTPAAVGSPKLQRGGRKASNPALVPAPSTSSPLLHSPPSQPYHSMQSSHPQPIGMPVFSSFYNLPGMNKPLLSAVLPVHPYTMNQQHQQQAFPQPSHFGSHHPPIIYQSLQPYGGIVPQQMMVDPRTGAILDPESLGHALAGAMNPEDL